MERTLEARLTEYRDSLLSTADQLAQVGADSGQPEMVADDVRFYRLVAGDLTTLLEGDELRRFVVTGTLP